ncbi:hypothetical protein EV697_10823 [Bisgaardia hudsonensis]|uniref:Lipoprotein n=1 Tax=Bisgaardia hudsonensis TaxID=109472 RepID=A0A4R2MW43_9PAST|nr:hypothetical protein [Bisgaardia hudsonensis]QLB12886.1 hypothetical protein A6A11_04315 [Bisgaardia hudsonensis]TCP11300.1 hypothetical protein EV697_10823 [Bisgaardia hudsonensis]
MRNWLLIFLIIGLAGCRATFVGSETVEKQWKKNGVHLQGKDFGICFDRKESVKTARDKYLQNKKYSERTPEEQNEWDLEIDRLMGIYFDCAYELGYRFKPDLGWCWEESLNMKRCRELKKYRN